MLSLFSLIIGVYLIYAAIVGRGKGVGPQPHLRRADAAARLRL